MEETDTGEGESWRSFGYSSEVGFVIFPSGGCGAAPGDESVFVTSGVLQWGDLQRCDSLSAPAKQDGTAELISLGDRKHKESRNKKADEKHEAINNKLHSTKPAFLHLKLDLFYGLVFCCSFFSNFTSLCSRENPLNCSQTPKNLNITTHIAQWHDALTPACANTEIYKTARSA